MIWGGLLRLAHLVAVVAVFRMAFCFTILPKSEKNGDPSNALIPPPNMRHSEKQNTIALEELNKNTNKIQLNDCFHNNIGDLAGFNIDPKYVDETNGKSQVDLSYIVVRDTLAKLLEEAQLLNYSAASNIGESFNNSNVLTSLSLNGTEKLLTVNNSYLSENNLQGLPNNYNSELTEMKCSVKRNIKHENSDNIINKTGLKGDIVDKLTENNNPTGSYVITKPSYNLSLNIRTPNNKSTNDDNAINALTNNNTPTFLARNNDNLKLKETTMIDNKMYSKYDNNKRVIGSNIKMKDILLSNNTDKKQAQVSLKRERVSDKLSLSNKFKDNSINPQISELSYTTTGPNSNMTAQNLVNPTMTVNVSSVILLNVSNSIYPLLDVKNISKIFPANYIENMLLDSSKISSNFTTPSPIIKVFARPNVSCTLTANFSFFTNNSDNDNQETQTLVKFKKLFSLVIPLKPQILESTSAGSDVPNSPDTTSQNVINGNSDMRIKSVENDTFYAMTNGPEASSRNVINAYSDMKISSVQNGTFYAMTNYNNETDNSSELCDTTTNAYSEMESNSEPSDITTACDTTNACSETESNSNAGDITTACATRNACTETESNCNACEVRTACDAAECATTACTTTNACNGTESSSNSCDITTAYATTACGTTECATTAAVATECATTGGTTECATTNASCETESSSNAYDITTACATTNAASEMGNSCDTARSDTSKSAKNDSTNDNNSDCNSDCLVVANDSTTKVTGCTNICNGMNVNENGNSYKLSDVEPLNDPTGINTDKPYQNVITKDYFFHAKHKSDALSTTVEYFFKVPQLHHKSNLDNIINRRENTTNLKQKYDIYSENNDNASYNNVGDINSNVNEASIANDLSVLGPQSTFMVPNDIKFTIVRAPTINISTQSVNCYRDYVTRYFAKTNDIFQSNYSTMSNKDILTFTFCAGTPRNKYIVKDKRKKLLSIENRVTESSLLIRKSGFSKITPTNSLSEERRKQKTLNIDKYLTLSENKKLVTDSSFLSNTPTTPSLSKGRKRQKYENAVKHVNEDNGLIESTNFIIPSSVDRSYRKVYERNVVQNKSHIKNDFIRNNIIASPMGKVYNNSGKFPNITILIHLHQNYYNSSDKFVENIANVANASSSVNELTKNNNFKLTSGKQACKKNSSQIKPYKVERYTKPCTSLVDESKTKCTKNELGKNTEYDNLSIKNNGKSSKMCSNVTRSINLTSVTECEETATVRNTSTTTPKACDNEPNIYEYEADHAYTLVKTQANADQSYELYDDITKNTSQLFNSVTNNYNPLNENAKTLNNLSVQFNPSFVDYEEFQSRQNKSYNDFQNKNRTSRNVNIFEIRNFLNTCTQEMIIPNSNYKSLDEISTENLIGTSCNMSTYYTKNDKLSFMKQANTTLQKKPNTYSTNNYSKTSMFKEIPLEASLITNKFHDNLMYDKYLDLVATEKMMLMKENNFNNTLISKKANTSCDDVMLNNNSQDGTKCASIKTNINNSLNTGNPKYIINDNLSVSPKHINMSRKPLNTPNRLETMNEYINYFTRIIPYNRNQIINQQQQEISTGLPMPLENINTGSQFFCNVSLQLQSAENVQRRKPYPMANNIMSQSMLFHYNNISKENVQVHKLGDNYVNYSCCV